ncbi:unnamed protein product, partial [Mesorhabditis belari]|uniref:C2H2-type domain-containing protein n=1 Tax=Mesorhabditis belari TaxID=2138241 RepID=A0AAF3EZQ5_9BILA
MTLFHRISPSMKVEFLFQGFDTKPDLQTIHTQMQMREAKPYKCTQCIKSFANSSYLSQHMRIHLGIKPFGPCQYCGKKFTQLSHLQQHIRTHTGEKPYKCKYQGCEKAFSQLSNLQSHSRCHQTDKPFKCNSCYKCFTDEQSLLEHIPKHKESKHLKVHICPFCGKSYTQSTYLQKHMTKHADRTRNMRFGNNGQEFTAETPTLDLNTATWNTQLPAMPEDPTTQHAQQQLAFNQFNASMMNVAAGQTTGGQSTYPPAASLNNGFAAFEHLLNFQRNNARGYLDQYQNNFSKQQAADRASGFNMITPLENIQRYTQGSGGTGATAVAAVPTHPQFQITGPMKPASY